MTSKRERSTDSMSGFELLRVLQTVCCDLGCTWTSAERQCVRIAMEEKELDGELLVQIYAAVRAACPNNVLGAHRRLIGLVHVCADLFVDTADRLRLRRRSSSASADSDRTGATGQVRRLVACTEDGIRRHLVLKEPKAEKNNTKSNRFDSASMGLLAERLVYAIWEEQSPTMTHRLCHAGPMTRINNRLAYFMHDAGSMSVWHCVKRRPCDTETFVDLLLQVILIWINLAVDCPHTIVGDPSLSNFMISDGQVCAIDYGFMCTRGNDPVSARKLCAQLDVANEHFQITEAVRRARASVQMDPQNCPTLVRPSAKTYRAAEKEMSEVEESQDGVWKGSIYPCNEAEICTQVDDQYVLPGVDFLVFQLVCHMTTFEKVHPMSDSAAHTFVERLLSEKEQKELRDTYLRRSRSGSHRSFYEVSFNRNLQWALYGCSTGKNHLSPRKWHNIGWLSFSRDLLDLWAHAIPRDSLSVLVERFCSKNSTLVEEHAIATQHTPSLNCVNWLRSHADALAA